MVHGGRGFLDIGVCDRQSKTSDASYEWRLANVITSVASSAFCVKSSRHVEHLHQTANLTLHLHFHNPIGPEDAALLKELLDCARGWPPGD